MKTLSQSAFHTATSPANPPSDSERLARIEAMVADLHNLLADLHNLFFGPDEAKPKDKEARAIARRMAVKAHLQGDRKALETFKRQWR